MGMQKLERSYHDLRSIWYSYFIFEIYIGYHPWWII